jgi:hypothetical protein
MDELRARLRRAEEDAAAARILAGGADRDVGELGREFRAFRDQNNRVLSAMRGDLTDLRGDLAELRHDLTVFRAQVVEQFARVDRNFLAVTGKIDGVATGLQVLTALLTRRERDDPPPS